MLIYGTFFKLATFRPDTVINTMILTFKSSNIVININTTNNHCQKLAFVLKEREDKVQLTLPGLYLHQMINRRS